MLKAYKRTYEVRAGGGGGGGGHHVNIAKKGGGHLLITWPGGGSYRNFDLPNIFFPSPPPLYINNDLSLTAYLHQLYFSFFSPPAVVTCAYKAAIFF